ncbi:MAG: substrate-binding domain-containing protein [Candidatus Promineifilaceae bacterium]|nr:substrate-binding domain-containing protein [Candidatus Promineifilaceae bacterium]
MCYSVDPFNQIQTFMSPKRSTIAARIPIRLRRFELRLWFLLAALILIGSSCGASRPAVILATTTSTQDSGLLDLLAPRFEEQSGYILKIIAVGTGQALAMGERGDADVLLVHAPAAEQRLIENGSAIDRRLVMHNDFVLVGPASDPADVAAAARPGDALARVAAEGAAGRAIFVSRGDDSGTHKKELSLWQEADLNAAGEWYLEAGQGMAATLRVASERQAYTLTDRGTYLAQRETLDLAILYQGAPELLNVYHVMRVNPDRFEAVNAAGAKAFSDFLIDPQTQAMIGDFGRREYGRPLFLPDAGKDASQLGLEQ